MAQEFKIEGLEHIEQSFKELGLKITKKLLRRAMKKAAASLKEKVESGARRAAGGPSHPEVGHFADHIIIRSRISLKKGTIVKVGPDDDHWWWTFQEYGTPHVPAKPFMRPALDTKAAEMIQIAAKDLAEGVEKEILKLAAKQVLRP